MHITSNVDELCENDGARAKVAAVPSDHREHVRCVLCTVLSKRYIGRICARFTDRRSAVGRGMRTRDALRACSK